jgi:hypothetical protein
VESSFLWVLRNSAKSWPSKAWSKKAWSKNGPIFLPEQSRTFTGAEGVDHNLEE